MDFLLDKKVLLYWRFTAAVLFAAVFSAFIIVFSLSAFRITVLVFSFSALLCLMMFGVLPMYFNATALVITNGTIMLRKGILIKREYIFPNIKTVYVQSFKPPLAACFGLRYLVIKGVGHSIVLPPLKNTEAERFKKAVQDIE